MRKFPITSDEISCTKTKLPFGWLGNMSPFPLEWKEHKWRTAEALFQALRFDEEAEIREEIRAAKSPMTAKMIAKKFVDQMVIKPQSPQDIKNMTLVLQLKIDQHPKLKKALFETKKRNIIEDCTKRQRGSGLFWGAARTEDCWIGENTLGELWMNIRNQLNEDDIPSIQGQVSLFE